MDRAQTIRRYGEIYAYLEHALRLRNADLVFASAHPVAGVSKILSHPDAVRTLKPAHHARIAAMMADIDELPAGEDGKQLTLEEQGLWQLGYYREKHRLSTGEASLVGIDEYARHHGLEPGTVRTRCLRGAYQTAVKDGNTWRLDIKEVFTDRRRGD